MAPIEKRRCSRTEGKREGRELTIEECAEAVGQHVKYSTYKLNMNYQLDATR
jgi:hypothetical protein